MMSPRSGHNKTMRVMVLHVTKAERKAQRAFRVCRAGPPHSGTVRAIITEMRILGKELFAQKAPLPQPPKFSAPQARAKLCKSTEFRGLCPAEAFCVAPQEAAVHGEPQLRSGAWSVRRPAVVIREAAARRPCRPHGPLRAAAKAGMPCDHSARACVGPSPAAPRGGGSGGLRVWKSLLILGAGGYGRTAAETAAGYGQFSGRAAFLDDAIARGTDILGPVYGRYADFAGEYAAGRTRPSAANALRAAVAAKAGRGGATACRRWRHPQSLCQPHAPMSGAGQLWCWRMACCGRVQAVVEAGRHREPGRHRWTTTARSARAPTWRPGAVVKAGNTRARRRRR